MQKSSLLLVGLLIILLAAGGVWYWYANRGETQHTNVNEVVVNINGVIQDPTITTENWEPEEKGDVAVNKEATHNDATFTFTSVAKPTEFRGKTAAEDKQFVVVYFREIPLAVRDMVTTWVRNDVKLKDGDVSYDVELYGLITEYSAPSETGYFQFTTPKDASGFVLHLGEGDGAQTVDLGI